MKTADKTNIKHKTRGIRGFVCITLVLAMILATSLPVFAFGDKESRSVQNFFVETQLLKGNGQTYDLDRKPTRMEAVVILIRLLGKEAEAQSMQNNTCRFKDVPEWATGYANYADKENISKGVSDTAFGFSEEISAQQFAALLLRTLGYDDSRGDFLWRDSVGKARDLAIFSEDMAKKYEAGAKYTKRDLIETAFCFLESEYKGRNMTLIDQLISNGAVNETIAEKYGLSVDGWKSISTNFKGDEYLEFKISGSKLIITGINDDADKEWLLAQINDASSEMKKEQVVVQRGSDDKYDMTISLGALPEGEYYVDIYGNKEKYSYYSSILLSNIKLKKTREGYYFQASPAYGQNIRIYQGDILHDSYYKMTLMTRASKESIETISNLAEEITKGMDNDYDKIRAVHDWVSENIYYDKDFVNKKTNSTSVNSVDMIKTRVGVCTGYANLTNDLICALGIPCKQVLGYSLRISTDGGWQNVNQLNASPNHVWNEAYVDGRWVIIDTTWDSSNNYEDGKQVYGGIGTMNYFDPTMEFFSNTHKLINL